MEEENIFTLLNDLNNGSIYLSNYQKSKEELIEQIEVISSWIVDRIDCDWCTIENCIEVDMENIDNLFRIFLAVDIVSVFSLIYREDVNKHSVIAFVNILNRAILSTKDKQQEFYKYLVYYGEKFITKIVNRLGVVLITIEEEKRETIDRIIGLPEIELNTQKEQIGLMYELGIIEYLQVKYPATLKGNNNQTAKLISQILRVQQNSIQPTVNALLNKNKEDKNSLKESNKIKAIIDLLNSNEQN
jgi:hypothetical protein